MATPSGTSTVPPFKFRRRVETVDWRHINKVDIHLVKSKLDIDTLQDHINQVTFCSLDGEQCLECRSPVDPGLLKVLQLAQLSVEWLLHCQEGFSLNQRAVEEKLEAALKEQKQLLEQQNEKEEKVKALKEELVVKEKVVRDLESKLLLCSHKCKICKKGFMTQEFLQSHFQRRHPEDHESQLQSDRDMKSQNEILKTEISGMKELIVLLQQTVQLKTAQEKRLECELEKFKAEEKARFETCKADSAHSQAQLLLNLEQQLKKQEELCKSMLQQKKEHHDSEMNKLQEELSRVQASVSGEQEMQRRQKDMERRLQEMQQTIEAQREQIISIKTTTKEVEVPVMVSAPAPKPKPKRKPKHKTDKEFTSKMAKVNSERDHAAKGMPGYWRSREEITRRSNERLSAMMEKESPQETQSGFGHSVQGSDRPSETLVSGPAGGQSQTPKPAPQAESTTPPKATPDSAAPRTFKPMETVSRMAKWIRGTAKKIKKSLSQPKKWCRCLKKSQSESESGTGSPKKSNQKSQSESESGTESPKKSNQKSQSESESGTESPKKSNQKSQSESESGTGSPKKSNQKSQSESESGTESPKKSSQSSNGDLSDAEENSSSSSHHSSTHSDSSHSP